MSNYSKHSNLFGVISLTFCAGIMSLGFIELPVQASSVRTGEDSELLAPCESCVYETVSSEVASEPLAGQVNSEAISVDIESYIREVFGKDGEVAVKIAMCESGLNPNNVGDKHLLGELNGELVGDSIGLFQIRTGDAGVYDSKPWNRAKANGMSVEEFRTWMKNPRANVEYAKEMFDRAGGFYPWHNCMKKVL